ncbi:zinc finger protein 541-like [Larus michahellis]|uniref:zinc finger protein 541-like n=1 Tax=Larus michahellis TaxID=119627 RepID=UPI003D9B1BA0
MGPKRTQEAERCINIGSQFQAELPDLQDPSHLEEEEEGASLVWKPWGDVETNPETQEKGVCPPSSCAAPSGEGRFLSELLNRAIWGTGLLSLPFPRLRSLLLSSCFPSLSSGPFSGGKRDFLWVFVAFVVRNLLHLASAKGGPGGRVNAELALHCLHEAQGDVLEAAEMLRAGPPRRPESHPLADYHYTGSDTWTPVEEQLFKEAFYMHKKNFRLIQKQIQTKSVSQCVEYYYTWKKKNPFWLHSASPDTEEAPKTPGGGGKRLKTRPFGVQRRGGVSSPRKIQSWGVRKRSPMMTAAPPSMPALPGAGTAAPEIRDFSPAASVEGCLRRSRGETPT